jgi:hypothetical protein
MLARRSRTLIFFGLVAVLLICWLVFALLSGRDSEPGGGAQDQARQDTAEQQASDPSAPPAPGESNETGAEKPGAGDPPKPSGDTGDEPESAQKPPEGQPVSQQNGERPPASAGESPEQSYEAVDPLGIEDEQVERGVENGARLAATNFITYAYGYTGDDKAKYLGAVKRAVLDPEFFQSPGGRTVQQTAALIDERGSIKNAARIEAFRVVKVDPEGDGLVGVARFSVGTAWAPPEEWQDGEPKLAGPVTSYEQRVSLIPWGNGADAWKLSAAGALQEVS